MVISIVNNGQLVTAEFECKGLVGWKLNFVQEGNLFAFNHLQPGPCIISLGLPHELDLITESFDVFILAIENANRDFSFQIKWLQGGALIAQWPPTPQTGTVSKADNLFIFRQDAIFSVA